MNELDMYLAGLRAAMAIPDVGKIRQEQANMLPIGVSPTRIPSLTPAVGDAQAAMELMGPNPQLGALERAATNYLFQTPIRDAAAYGYQAAVDAPGTTAQAIGAGFGAAGEYLRDNIMDYTRILDEEGNPIPIEDRPTQPGFGEIFAESRIPLPEGVTPEEFQQDIIDLSTLRNRGTNTSEGGRDGISQAAFAAKYGINPELSIPSMMEEAGMMYGINDAFSGAVADLGFEALDVAEAGLRGAGLASSLTSVVRNGLDTGQDAVGIARDLRRAAAAGPSGSSISGTVPDSLRGTSLADGPARYVLVPGVSGSTVEHGENFLSAMPWLQGKYTPEQLEGLSVAEFRDVFLNELRATRDGMYPDAPTSWSYGSLSENPAPSMYDFWDPMETWDRVRNRVGLPENSMPSVEFVGGRPVSSDPAAIAHEVTLADGSAARELTPLYHATNGQTPGFPRFGTTLGESRFAGTGGNYHGDGLIWLAEQPEFAIGATATSVGDQKPFTLDAIRNLADEGATEDMALAGARAFEFTGTNVRPQYATASRLFEFGRDVPDDVLQDLYTRFPETIARRINDGRYPRAFVNPEYFMVDYASTIPRDIAENIRGFHYNADNLPGAVALTDTQTERMRRLVGDLGTAGNEFAQIAQYMASPQYAGEFPTLERAIASAAQGVPFVDFLAANPGISVNLWDEVGYAASSVNSTSRTGMGANLVMSDLLSDYIGGGLTPSPTGLGSISMPTLKTVSPTDPLFAGYADSYAALLYGLASSASTGNFYSNGSRLAAGADIAASMPDNIVRGLADFDIRTMPPRSQYHEDDSNFFYLAQVLFDGDANTFNQYLQMKGYEGLTGISTEGPAMLRANGGGRVYALFSPDSVLSFDGIEDVLARAVATGAMDPASSEYAHWSEIARQRMATGAAGDNTPVAHRNPNTALVRTGTSNEFDVATEFSDYSDVATHNPDVFLPNSPDYRQDIANTYERGLNEGLRLGFSPSGVLSPDSPSYIDIGGHGGAWSAIETSMVDMGAPLVRLSPGAFNLSSINPSDIEVEQGLRMFEEDFYYAAQEAVRNLFDRGHVSPSDLLSWDALSVTMGSPEAVDSMTGDLLSYFYRFMNGTPIPNGGGLTYPSFPTGDVTPDMWAQIMTMPGMPPEVATHMQDALDAARTMADQVIPNTLNLMGDYNPGASSGIPSLQSFSIAKAYIDDMGFTTMKPEDLAKVFDGDLSPDDLWPPSVAAADAGGVWSIQPRPGAGAPAPRNSSEPLIYLLDPQHFSPGGDPGGFDFFGWEDVGTALGPQTGGPAGGALGFGGFFDMADGRRAYVKIPDNPDQAYTEWLSTQLYQDFFNAAVPTTTLGANPNSAPGMGANVYHISELLDGGGTLKDDMSFLTEASARSFLDGALGDILMANWDVVGTGPGFKFGNIYVDPNFNDLAYRIDNGGALWTGGLGNEKPANALRQVRELETFTDPSMSPEYVRVLRAAFGDSADIASEYRNHVALQYLDMVASGSIDPDGSIPMSVVSSYSGRVPDYALARTHQILYDRSRGLRNELLDLAHSGAFDEQAIANEVIRVLDPLGYSGP